MKAEDMIVCLFDSHHGVYIPQYFAEDNSLWNMFGLEPYKKERKILLYGPDHEDYWEVWSDIVMYAFYEDENYFEWSLYELDGDLFMVADGYFELIGEV